MSASEIAAAPVSGTGPRVTANQTPHRRIFINSPDLYLKSRLYWMPLKKKASIPSLSPSPSLFFTSPYPAHPTRAACQVLRASSQAVTKPKSTRRCAVYFPDTRFSVCVSVVIGCQTCRWSQRQRLGLFTAIKLSRTVIHDILSCYHVKKKG